MRRAMLSPLLFVPGLVFGSAARIRNALYARGVLRSVRLEAPVISIGNLTLGGTGKTPLVIHTARLVLELGRTPALLSRGYGRVDPHIVRILPPGNEIPSPARNLGDEPALIRRKVPEIWLGVSKERGEVGRQLLERRSNLVFILDDGFQHRRVERDLDVLVIDPSQPFERNHVVPFGSLREPLAGMRRADVVIVNSRAGHAAEDLPESRIRCGNPDAPIFRCTQRISGFTSLEMWRRGENAGSPPPFRSAYLIAAIGNPGRFEADMRDQGIRITGTSFFRDHSRISAHEWHACMHRAQDLGSEAVVTTEKDAIKIKYTLPAPLTIALQSTELSHGSEYRRILARVLEESR